MLTIIDLFTPECLGIVTRQSLKRDDVKEALTRIPLIPGTPKILKYDNSSEFAGKVFDRWAHEHGAGGGGVDLPARQTDG